MLFSIPRVAFLHGRKIMGDGEQSLLAQLQERQKRQRKSEHRKELVGLSDKTLTLIVRTEGTDTEYAETARDILVEREKLKVSVRHLREVIEKPIQERE